MVKREEELKEQEEDICIQDICIADKSIRQNLFGIKDSYSIMRRLFCIDFIEYMLAVKTLLDYTNLFCPNDYKKNNKIIYKYSKDKYVKS